MTPYVLDAGTPLFAGLNVLPKKSTLTEYSTRVDPSQLQTFMDLWHTNTRLRLPESSRSFDLDFHTIPSHGKVASMEKHSVSKRSRRQRGILALVARDDHQRRLVYANADVSKATQNEAALRFVETWVARTGQAPEELVFDSRLTTYAILAELNERGIRFLTLRRRFKALVAETNSAPEGDWKTVRLSTITRESRRARVLETHIRVRNYPGQLRQLAIKGLGYVLPTFLMTNDFETSKTALIDRYARCMLVENAIEDTINFFHMDALSAAVPLNINVDLQLTLMASGLYRMPANRFPPMYARAKARTLFKSFIDVPARIKTTDDQIIVRFKRRSYNSLLRQAGYVGSHGRIPWMHNRELILDYL